MTGYESYLKDNGWVRTSGNGIFNTYDNCQNVYDKDGYSICIGLLGNFNSSGCFISVLDPCMDYIPTSNFKDYTDKLISGKINYTGYDIKDGMKKYFCWCISEKMFHEMKRPDSLKIVAEK